MIISCYANDVKLAYIYIRGEFAEGARILNRALAEARAKNFLGKNILGSGYDLRNLRPSRRRRLHLRRRNRPDRIARRQARLSAHQAAVFPGGARALHVPDDRQQRRDALRREAHRRRWAARSSRSSARRTTPARASCSVSGHVQEAGLLRNRSRQGHDRRTDQRSSVWRRVARRAQAEGGHSRRFVRESFQGRREIQTQEQGPGRQR